MRSSITLVGLILSVAIASADAQTVPPSTKPSSDVGSVSTAKAAPDPDEVVCSKQMITGSLVPRKICQTRRQQEQESDAGKAYAERMQNNGFHQLGGSQMGGK